VGLFIFVVFDSLSTCKVIEAKVPHLVFEAEKRVRDGLDVPNYEESSMRLAVLNAHIIFRKLPINRSRRLYWQTKNSR
jgi:hypothetical protein